MGTPLLISESIHHRVVCFPSRGLGGSTNADTRQEARCRPPHTRTRTKYPVRNSISEKVGEAAVSTGRVTTFLVEVELGSQGEGRGEG